MAGKRATKKLKKGKKLAATRPLDRPTEIASLGKSGGLNT